MGEYERFIDKKWVFIKKLQLKPQKIVEISK
jgi:hypothetical protein